MLEQKLLSLKTEAIAKLEQSKTAEEVEILRVQYLGRKAELNAILKGLRDLTVEEKRVIGPLGNTIKKEIEQAVDAAETRIKHSVSLDHEKIDVTIPGKKVRRGHFHPITIVQKDIEDIFTSMGFDIADGPEIEIEHYNFDALNVPKDHPARDMQDTFWVKSEIENKKSKGKSERLVLRTQTSPMQVRYMETHKPPLRVIVPGRIFRNEATDATHDHTFHQFEALVVGEDINVGHFKYIAEQFFSRFFKKDVLVRLRPSYFPFTEPSFEFDISCTVCGGKGCQACKQTGWLEVGGAGMVNQNVFVSAGYPKGKYQGFAWGFGLERLAMMKYKINDIRVSMTGDLRFINQF